MTATTQQQETALPAGNWQVDAIHSRIGFSVKYVVQTFGGEFTDFGASLQVAEDGAAKLTGTVKAASISVKNDDLTAHLQAPDFLDVERYPELKFESTAIRREGDQVVVDGQLTIKGNTHVVEGRGPIAGPSDDAQGYTKLGVTLETVIDRTAFGVDWNAALPAGGFALANDVKLTIDLVLVKA